MIKPNEMINLDGITNLNGMMVVGDFCCPTTGMINLNGLIKPNEMINSDGMIKLNGVINLDGMIAI